MVTSNITFRTQLLGGVHDFCNDCQLDLLQTQMILVELIVLLARYKEEGVSLCPQVYLTSNINSLISMLPESSFIKIGEANRDVSGVKLVIKRCAPLAINGWHIYVNDLPKKIEYGLFRGSDNPISIKVDDAIIGEHTDFKVVKVAQIADECVEIQCSAGKKHNIFLNHRPVESPPPLQFLDNLVNSLTDKAPIEHKESVASFLSKLLDEALRESHGCIIAVTNARTPPKFITSDGILLEKPVNFSDLIGELKKEP